MLVDRAGETRTLRYDRWYPLLQKELDLCATPKARIIAVGNVVFQYLNRRKLPRLHQVIHYSGLAGSARRAGVKGREDSFESFKDSVSLEDVLVTAEATLRKAGIPTGIRDETLSRLRKSQLTTSRRELIFIYKTAFDSMRSPPL